MPNQATKKSAAKGGAKGKAAKVSKTTEEAAPKRGGRGHDLEKYSAFIEWLGETQPELGVKLNPKQVEAVRANYKHFVKSDAHKELVESRQSAKAEAREEREAAATERREAREARQAERAEKRAAREAKAEARAAKKAEREGKAGKRTAAKKGAGKKSAAAASTPKASKKSTTAKKSTKKGSAKEPF